MILTIRILLILIVWTSTAVAADTIYIAQTSAGGDTGADCANAHSAAWFNTAGNWGTDAGDITAGDTVHLCGTITTSLIARGSGSAGSPITIIFEDGAKISKTSCGDYCLSTNSQTYITIDGGTNGIIESTDMGTGLGGSKTSYNIGVQASGCSNCEIKNLHIHDMYKRTLTTDVTDVTYNLYIGIAMNGSNTLIHDNVIHDTGTAIQYFYTAGDDVVKIYNNNMSNSGHILALAAVTNTTSGSFYYYGNTVHDLASWDSSGCSVAHTSAIHAYGISGAKITGTLWIYNNSFLGTGSCMTGNIFLEGGSDGWTDSTGTAKIFNNLITASGYVTGLAQAYLGTNHEIYNNTIIGNGNSSSVCLQVGGSTTNIKIKNNYISNCGHLIHAYAAETIQTGLEIDYNVYANCSGYNCWWVGSTDTGSFAAYRAALPAYDAHSVDTTTDDGGVNQTTGVPSTEAETIGVGVNLSSLGYTALNSDKSSVARGTTWDIGAYELDTETDVTAPTLSSLTPSGTISYQTSTQLSVASNESATCRYHASSTTWGDMTAMSSTGGTTHTQTVNVSVGANSFKVKCQDAAENESDAGTWSFTVSAAPVTPPAGTFTRAVGGTITIGVGGTITH